MASSRSPGEGHGKPRLNQGAEGSISSPSLEALLDQLVAVRMDLEPVCGGDDERARVVAPLDSIANACEGPKLGDRGCTQYHRPNRPTNDLPGSRPAAGSTGVQPRNPRNSKGLGEIPRPLILMVANQGFERAHGCAHAKSLIGLGVLSRCYIRWRIKCCTVVRVFNATIVERRANVVKAR